MPKNRKTQPKKQLKKKQKDEPKPVSILSSKYYWIGLTAAMVVFGLALGVTMNINPAAIGMMLGAVVAVIAFAVYLKFQPSSLKTRYKATFIFAGASIFGFLIWAAITSIIRISDLGEQVVAPIGEGFFAITSLIICLVLGAFIGDLIGKSQRVQEHLQIPPKVDAE